jgi:hypothetical protein
LPRFDATTGSANIFPIVVPGSAPIPHHENKKARAKGSGGTALRADDINVTTVYARAKNTGDLAQIPAGSCRTDMTARTPRKVSCYLDTAWTASFRTVGPKEAGLSVGEDDQVGRSPGHIRG